MAWTSSEHLMHFEFTPCIKGGYSDGLLLLHKRHSANLQMIFSISNFIVSSSNLYPYTNDKINPGQLAHFFLIHTLGLSFVLLLVYNQQGLILSYWYLQSLINGRKGQRRHNVDFFIILCLKKMCLRNMVFISTIFLF